MTLTSPNTCASANRAGSRVGYASALLLSRLRRRDHAETSQFLGPEWQWLWREVRPFWGYQAANLCCIFAFSALMMCVPLLMRWVIDDILPARRWGALVIASILFFVFYVGRVLLTAGGSLINKMGVQRVVLRLRTRLLERLQSLPASFHDVIPSANSFSDWRETSR